jgi:hypothetical protein
MSRTHYIASAIAFGALFMILGFFADAATSGAAGGYEFSFWLSHPGLWIWWCIAGCALGLVFRYAISNRRP